MVSVPAGVIAIAEINEALNSGDAEKTFAALTLPTAKLQGVNPATAKHYHDLLLHTKELICKVLISYYLRGVAEERIRNKFYTVFLYL